MTIEPYYHDEASGITIYHADCRDVLPHIDPASVDLVLTDPPYGMAIGDRAGGPRDKATQASNDYYVIGDDVPFDPTPLLAYGRNILFGANHFADKLPPSPSWIVWDKRDGTTSDDNADCELIWSNVGGPARLFTHLWRGMIKASEKNQKRMHPTQKPVALMTWILHKWTEPGDLVFDPYMGSGPIAQACYITGRRYIGIEMEERYCEIAVKRLQQAVLPLEVA